MRQFSMGSALMPEGGGGERPMMAYTGRLRPKGVLFSGLRYMKEKGFHSYLKGNTFIAVKRDAKF